MKKSIQLLGTILLTLVVTFSAFSNTKPDPRKLSMKLIDGKMKLAYKNDSNGKVMIELVNTLGEVIHQEEVKRNQSFAKIIDFNLLGDGQYKVQLSGAKKKYVKEVWVFKNAHIALLKQKYNTYKLLYGSKEPTAIDVQFLNESGQVVMEDFFQSSKGFSKVYQVSSRKTNATALRIITESDSKEFKLN